MHALMRFVARCVRVRDRPPLGLRFSPPRTWCQLCHRRARQHLHACWEALPWPTSVRRPCLFDVRGKWHQTRSGRRQEQVDRLWHACCLSFARMGEEWDAWRNVPGSQGIAFCYLASAVKHARRTIVRSKAKPCCGRRSAGVDKSCRPCLPVRFTHKRAEDLMVQATGEQQWDLHLLSK